MRDHTPRSRGHHRFLDVSCGPAHSLQRTEPGGTLNTGDSDRWLVSPGVRSTYVGDGAVLLDVEERLCYRLNGVAAQIWVTIEGSPAGIRLKGVVDVLETQFTVSREELERDAGDCLAELQLAGLVQEEVVTYTDLQASSCRHLVAQRDPR